MTNILTLREVSYKAEHGHLKLYKPQVFDNVNNNPKNLHVSKYATFFLKVQLDVGYNITHRPFYAEG